MIELETDPLEARVVEALAGLLKVDPARLVPAAMLVDDLGVDSLEFLTFVVGLERAFDVEVPDKEAAGMATVADVIEVIRRNSPGGSEG